MNKKKNTVKINYVVDLVIGIGFLLAAVSGIVLLFAGSGGAGAGGYQGGRNARYTSEALLLSRHAWNDLHTWSSIIMIAGVLGHLILHWNWIVCMTRNLFAKKKLTAGRIEACATE